MNQLNETPKPEQKTASELHTQLGIEQAFKDWIPKQPGFANFKSFFGKLPGGALGKDYRLTPEQCEQVLKAQQPKPIASGTETPGQPVTSNKRVRLQPKPGVELADGFYSLEAYTQAVFGEVFPDKRGKHMGIHLSSIARQRKISIEKAPHPVWGEVNTYPKTLLDRFFGVSNAKVKPKKLNKPERKQAEH